MNISNSPGQSMAPSHGLVEIMRRHPLVCFFLLAYSFSLLTVAPLGTALAFATSTAPPPTTSAPLSDPHELETFLDGVLGVQLMDDHIPGATVAVVKDGRLFFAKGYGDADIQNGKQVSADHTLFRVGSVSKLFIWTAIMQLSEQGKVDLHADVNTYLKTFRIPATYPQPITLAHLLTHTAGFEDRYTGIFVPTTSDLKPLGKWLAANIPARVRPPGELTAYSNYGAALAGYIVEQVSGIPFDQYVEQHIFKPLGMNHSTFSQPVPASLVTDVSQGYTYTNGTYRAEPFEYVEIAPAGSLSATATDMANFMIAHLQNGRFGNQRILQDATAREMHTQHFTNDPRVPGMDYGFWEQRLNNQRVIEHGGDTILFHTLLALLPERNVGVFVSYNSPAGETARDTLLQAFLDHYFPAPKEPAPHPLAGFDQRANQISGTYWATRRSYTTYEKVFQLFTTVNVNNAGNGHLAISVGGGQTTDVVEVAPRVFQTASGHGSAVFRPGPNGMLMLLGSAPIEAFIQVPWYDAPTFHFLLLAVCVLFFLSALLLWPLLSIRTVMRRRALRKKLSPDAALEGTQTRGIGPLLAGWLAWIVSALNILFLIMMLIIFSNQENILYGVTPALTTLFMLATLSALLTVGVVLCAIMMWWRRFWRPWQRVYYTLVALGALAFAWELVFWNLIGLHV